MWHIFSYVGVLNPNFGLLYVNLTAGVLKFDRNLLNLMKTCFFINLLHNKYVKGVLNHSAVLK